MEISQRMKGRLARWFSPFTSPVPDQIRDTLVQLQYRRLTAALPLLCILIAANAVAMALAVMGDLPWWQQLAPPILIIGTCLAVWARTRGERSQLSAQEAHRFLSRAPLVTVPLGLVAGFWCVNAFTEMEKYYCMTAPVFIGIAALISATCLIAAPRAAIGAMVATIAPIAVKMAFFNYLGIRAMDAMMVMVTLMQARVVLGKFEETVQMLVFQAELNRLAGSDPLTGLDNRLAFDTALDRVLDDGAPALVALADLDGFKAVNDTYGHQAGDAVLVEVARRLRLDIPSAASLARLGGDEFAILFAVGTSQAQAMSELAAMRETAKEPFDFAGSAMVVGISFGTAWTMDGGFDAVRLLRSADERLYADKAARRALGRVQWRETELVPVN